LALAHDIDAFIARNEQLAEEIKTLKGIRKCEKCGENLAAGCVYCPSCGAKNEPLQQSSAKASVKAKPVAAQDFSGNSTQQTAAFVPAEPQAEQSEPVQQSAPVPPVNRAPAAIFCGQCGYKETPDAVFCSNCGSKLQK
jgi:uncharacterized OB-fold protein